jgi:cytochrome c-type biogenesis protein CcmH/NrfG
VSRTQPVRAQLVELQALRDQGLITAREAATKRKQILSSL